MKMVTLAKKLPGFHQYDPVVALTCLGDELFVLRDRDVSQVEVYSTKTSEDFTQRRQISVSDLDTDVCSDMTSCVRRRCLYISDGKNSRIHKSTSTGDVIAKWPVPNTPVGVSLTPTNNLLVTCYEIRKLVELCSESGDCVRQVELQSDIVRPWHAIQLASQLYVVLHTGDELSMINVVDFDGRILPKTPTSACSRVPQLRWPYHMATDRDHFVFVADHENNGLILLSPSMEFLRRISLKQRPHRLYLDHATRCLYVGHHSGDVTVIRV